MLGRVPNIVFQYFQYDQNKLKWDMISCMTVWLKSKIVLRQTQILSNTYFNQFCMCNVVQQCGVH